MKRRKRHPEFRYMIVGLAAFVCTAAIVLVQTYADRELHISMTALCVTVFIFSVFAPVFAKFDAYSEMFGNKLRETRFNPSFAINEYRLHGRIKGKYMFLDAVRMACSGDFERAFELYTDCLGKASDERLRLACYKDMVKNLKRMNDPIRLVPYIRRGVEEFPRERSLFEWVAGYYTWSRIADRKEAEEWFTHVAEMTDSDHIKARAAFFCGMSALYDKDYEKADRYYIQADSLFDIPQCYLLIDMAVCRACMGRYDEAREFAVQAVSITDDSEDIDYISEKLSYLFKAKTGEVNPEVEKLVDELKRRRDYYDERSVKVSDIERFTERVEQAKQLQE